MAGKAKGQLIIIGGHEEKEAGRDRPILEEVSRRAKERKGSLLITTVATNKPEELAATYTAVFRDLGVQEIDVLDIRTREEAHARENVDRVQRAAVVFFTGGDQLRITSQVGDSSVYRCLQEIHERGATIVGTSAGAAAMPETMLISGAGEESNRVSALGMAPGLALMHGVVIDSHFAERGRMGRLLGAVAQNPRNLGIGIDEDTAIVVENGDQFTVLGSGAVYVVDGSTMTYSSLSERSAEGVLNIHDVTLHVLGAGDCFDLTTRRPVAHAEASAG